MAIIRSLAGKLVFRWMPSFMWYTLIAVCIPLVLLIFFQVWARYIFHLPLLWVEEVAIVPAFWLYMMGAAYAVYERTHISVDLVEITIHRPKRRLLVRFIASVITLGLAMLFLWWGYNFFTWDLQMNPQTMTLRFPMIYGRSSFFLAAGILGGFYFWVETIDLARQLFWGKESLMKKSEE